MKIKEILMESEDWKSYRQIVKQILSNKNPELLDRLAVDMWKDVYADFKEGMSPQETAKKLFQLFDVDLASSFDDDDDEMDWTEYTMRQGEKGFPDRNR